MNQSNNCYCDDGLTMIDYNYTCTFCPANSSFVVSTCVCDIANYVYLQSSHYCVCKENYQLRNGECTLCPNGLTKQITDSTCQCPVGYSFLIFEMVCTCAENYTNVSNCTACPSNSYKTIQDVYCNCITGFLYSVNENICRCDQNYFTLDLASCQICPT